jgi:YVTN family beta-propeller protein
MLKTAKRLLLWVRLHLRAGFTLTASWPGFGRARSGAFRRLRWDGAVAVAVVAVVACLAGGLPASASGPRRGGTPQARVTPAPALPGAQPISGNDRVYTADQDSNTVTVIDPKTDTVLGTIPMGAVRLDTNADTLGAMYDGQIDVHGLGFSRDGQYVDVMDVTTNAVQVIDTATNKVIRTIYVGRAPHEGFFSPDGRTIWVAVRGQDYVAVIDWKTGQVIHKIYTEPGPSKVVFSPDGRLAYVNHLRALVEDVIDVANRKVIDRVPIPAVAGGSSDEAISPDGREVWLGMPTNGWAVSVINTTTHRVEAVLNTGPRTNHPNFVTVGKVNYAYLTVGNLNETLVFRRPASGGPPVLVKRIPTCCGPHGIWPSPDNTRIYVALQYSDGVDVINTKTMKVIKTLHVGQSPMALVYVARSGPGSTAGLSHQGLGMRNEYLPAFVQGATGQATVQVRALPGLDEVVLVGWNLPAGTPFTLYAARGNAATALLSTTTSAGGDIGEAFAFTDVFANHYSRFILRRSP